MNDIFHISKLVIKKKLKVLTDAEKSQLKQFKRNYPFSKGINFEYITQRISEHIALDKQKAWEAVVIKAQQGQNTPVIPIYRKPWFKYTAAASVVFVLALTVFLNKDNNQQQFTEPIIVNNQIEKGTDKATLTLENGEQVTLTKGDTYQTQDATSNGEEIIYDSSSTSSELVYNHLTIPRGGQFHLILSDGTQVWLNSESQLKYPVAFNKGETRQVELVYGEAYFDVSPSTNHNGADFKVYHKDQEVQVLGTEFNIKAYKDEVNVYTTLVEGKVAVSYLDQSQNLNPGQQAALYTVQNKLEISNVNAIREIAWINGEFMLEHKTLTEIMQVLSRWYDMDVIFETEKLRDVRFVGVLGKDQSIIEILETIKNFGVITNYEINNKTITLK
ncbi:FecR domain-containing protein [Flavivirga amylovorans]|uniref:FecR domain-containing protein n=1 Tax=Flavivirga amylovorans TaxID=870486 RepID=A0ABT8X0Q1_9FLAO|nr:FecR family protein [Flavivirga amylovorans]MDO5987527.1 FecR domain-containing protein [Flavivirga amylovorans]